MRDELSAADEQRKMQDRKLNAWKNTPKRIDRAKRPGGGSERLGERDEGGGAKQGHNESTNESEHMKTHEETWVSWTILSINMTRIGADNREVIGAAVGQMTSPSAATTLAAARAWEMARLLLRIGLGAGGDEEDPLCGCCGRPVNLGTVARSTRARMRAREHLASGWSSWRLGTRQTHRKARIRARRQAQRRVDSLVCLEVSKKGSPPVHAGRSSPATQNEVSRPPLLCKQWAERLLGFPLGLQSLAGKWLRM